MSKVNIKIVWTVEDKNKYGGSLISNAEFDVEFNVPERMVKQGDDDNYVIFCEVRTMLNEAVQNIGGKLTGKEKK